MLKMLRLGYLGTSAALHAGIVGALLLAGAWSLSSTPAQMALSAPPPHPVAVDVQREIVPDRPSFEATELPAPLPVEDVELPVESEAPALEEPPAPRIAPDRPSPRLDRPQRTTSKLPAPAEAAATPVAEVQAEIAPVEIHNPAPGYPAAARRRRQEGFVVVELLVRADGSVADPQVVEQSGSPLFAEEVLRVVAEWRYRPATLGGAAVESRQRVRFIFRLE